MGGSLRSLWRPQLRTHRPLTEYRIDADLPPWAGWSGAWFASQIVISYDQPAVAALVPASDASARGDGKRVRALEIRPFDAAVADDAVRNAVAHGAVPVPLVGGHAHEALDIVRGRASEVGIALDSGMRAAIDDAANRCGLSRSSRKGLLAAMREMTGMQAAISPAWRPMVPGRFEEVAQAFDSARGKMQNAAGASGSWSICLIAAAGQLAAAVVIATRPPQS